MKIQVWRPRHDSRYWWYAFSVQTGGMTGTASTREAAEVAAERWMESKLNL